MPTAFSSDLAAGLAEDLLERFLRYVRIDTTSVPGSDAMPSSPGQRQLAELLVGELRSLGLGDAVINEEGSVTATLPGSGERVVGLLAHLDTSPDAPGANVQPLVHRDYDGTDIVLPRNGTVLSPSAMPELAERAGHHIVTSSGDTLLGADDKAGMAEIMAAVAHLAHHPELPRPTLRIGFLPDEEIGGAGAQQLDLQSFGADFAYTLDGSEPGELQDESFTAQEICIVVDGHEVHPGQAFGKMANAIELAARIAAALPRDRLTPATSRGRDGFIHLHALSGDVRRAEASFIVRDFDDAELDRHVALVRSAADRIIASEPRARMSFTVNRQYHNMRTFLARSPEIVEVAERAMRAEGITPARTAIRGGTDGSILSERGLPTPNLFTGGHEYHSVREWSSLQEMASAAATVVRLAGEWGRPPDGGDAG